MTKFDIFLQFEMDSKMIIRSIPPLSWHDISNVVNHKRTFNIECTMPENSVGFTLTDADTGRYFWKLCVLQHTFYMKYEQNQKHPPELASFAPSSTSSANPSAPKFIREFV